MCIMVLFLKYYVNELGKSILILKLESPVLGKVN